MADGIERNNHLAYYKELVVETYALYQRDISYPSVGKNAKKKKRIKHKEKMGQWVTARRTKEKVKHNETQEKTN